MKHTVHKKIFKAFCVTTLMCLVVNVSAQDFINEDFLDDLDKNAKSIWNEAAPAFATNSIPDKWKNESAIVIGYRRSLLVDKKSSGGFFTARDNSLYFYEKVRFKVKVQDKNSVEVFTEVYFRYGSRDDGFIAHIIKPSGEVDTVDLKDAVSVESNSEVPEFFKSFFDQEYSSEKRYYKVAIPDLEPGDILEYVTNTKSKLNIGSSGYIEFTPQYEVCSKKYPVMYNEIDLETDNKSFFKSLSLNGAPEFKKENSDDPDFYRYVFIDKDRGTEKDVNFINQLLVYPVVKFQMIYSNKANVKGALIGDKGELKKGFSREDLARKAWEDYESVGNYYMGRGVSVQNFVNASWMMLKKIGADDWNEQTYIKNVYYYIRNQVVFRDGYLADKFFAYIFASLLNKRNISSDVIITVANDVGTLKNVLFDSEIRYVTRVKGQLYYNCTDHSNPGELVMDLLGNDSYIIYAPPRNGEQEIKDFILPETTSDENTATYVIDASLNADMTSLVISRTSIMKGLYKTRNMAAAMRFIPYMLDDYKYYGGSSPTEGMNERQEEDYNNSVKALKDEFKKQKPEFVKNQIEREFGQKISFQDFQLTSDGRSPKKADLIFTEKFTLPGKVRKAGKKFLVNLNGLVGSQLQIKKEEKERKYDIEVDYARSLVWKINFKIPDGYTVDGLKELQQNVNNEVGLFSCEAKEEAGMIQVTITKTYKERSISKSKWPEMLAFVDAAYNASFKYILLKPKG